MNPTLINFHRHRFEWASQAKEKFIDHFKEEILPDLQQDEESLDINGLSFHRLTELFKQAEEENKRELEQLVSLIENYERLIERHTVMLNQEWQEAVQQYNRITSEIQIYKEFSKQFVFKDIHPDPIRQLVNDNITNKSGTRKASVINKEAANFQENIKMEIEAELWRIKQEADIFNIPIALHHDLPYISPIPRIIQKIDTFWLKNSYEKAVKDTRDHACNWLKNMYLNYNTLLTPLYQEVISQKQLLVKEAEELKLLNEERRKKQESRLSSYKKERAELDARYQQVYRMSIQVRDHASQLQCFFIKYFLEYKGELEKHLQYDNVEERWLAFQYLQLLLQDGKKIIESLNG